MTKDQSPSSIDDYKKAGVDDYAANDLSNWIKKEKPKNYKNTNELISFKPLSQEYTEHGDFCSVIDASFDEFKHPLLVSTTDGVGTKIIFAKEFQVDYSVIGTDLVAMCANDLFTVGARALGFLDYFATDKLSIDQFKSILKGIKNALEYCQCPLLGGETAQLPGLIAKGNYDVAGFMMGLVDRHSTIGKHRVKENDRLYAFKSSGFHSNGYTLLRKILKDNNINKKNISQKHLHLLSAPTKIYLEIPKLVQELTPSIIHAAAHITGGGISGNLARIIPDSLYAKINSDRLFVCHDIKEFFELYTQKPFDYYLDVFNLGCGMIVSVCAKNYLAFEKTCEKLDCDLNFIGSVEKKLNSTDKPVKFIKS